MISGYLDKCINDIENLTKLTYEDIDDIKVARNEKIYERAKIKESIISQFESDKSMLDEKLSSIVRENGGEDISKLLSNDEKKRLEKLKSSLDNLQTVNKRYARLVVAVNEFYTNLFDKIFPSEMENYKKIQPKSFSLLKVSA